MTIGGSFMGRFYFKTKTFEDNECLTGSCIKKGALFLQKGLRSVRPIIQIISTDSLIRITQLHLLNMQTVLKEILLLQPFQNPRPIQ
jgi:hypothetical protein